MHASILLAIPFLTFAYGQDVCIGFVPRAKQQSDHHSSPAQLAAKAPLQRIAAVTEMS